MTLGRRVFADEARAEALLSRLGRLGEVDRLVEAVAATADPDRALLGLDRWIGAHSDAGPRLVSVNENQALLHRLAMIMGASQPITDTLVKNPELALILGDPSELSRPVNSMAVVEEGRALMGRANSFLHALDRLRHLRARHQLRIVANDLSGAWEPHLVWQALSALADGVLELAAEWVWHEIAPSNELPIAVIALGKHGSSEVNYSSDLDLLFICEDDAETAACEKFCGKFVRALEGKMGRGALYRIDLRLRPMGAAGPVVLGLGATLRYYESYCEPWEIQALIRSRACAGNSALGDSFVRQASKLVYKGARSDVFLDGIIDAKRRYEAETRRKGEAGSNIKLGPGGIRDIEFVVQMFQLTLGHEMPSLQGAGVVPAIDVLADSGVLAPRNADLLRSSYRFFRQIEHRIQLRQDLQTHILPMGPHERHALAKLTGFSSWQGLDSELRRRRAMVRDLLETNVPALAQTRADEQKLAEALHLQPGSDAAASAERLLATSDSPKAILAEVLEDPSTAERVELLVTRAPRVVNELSFHKELWDVAFGEEVEFEAADDLDPGRAMLEATKDLRPTDALDYLESALRREAFLCALKHAHHSDVERSYDYVASVAETALLISLDAVGGEDLDIIAMGRLGSREPLLGSDWDVLLLCEDQESQARAERVGQDWVRAARRLSIASGNFPLDVRLRPEGGAGLVVRSVAGLLAYTESSMEAWERLAFTRGRSLRGNGETIRVINKAWSSKEWTWEDEQEIIHMRKRVQSERMRPWEKGRDLKLSEGCMLDIEWLVAVLKLRHPEAAPEIPEPTHVVAKKLGEARALSKADATALSEAALFYAGLRNSMYLLDMDSDSVLPENPEKLDRLADWSMLDSANELLGEVASRRERVSAVFTEVFQTG
jgi:glutamate-ammonia-ligase adenylyltransferase